VTLELVPLGTARIQLQPFITLEATPRGTFHIIELTDITIDGDRLQAKQKGVAAADWLLVDNEGVGTLDVRYCAETVDGAVVYASYSGRVDLSGGLSTASVYATPLFQTGDPRYAWLNKVQAVAKGKVDQSMLLTYEVYELR
jgi:Protein of unknown function (DUF3237)